MLQIDAPSRFARNSALAFILGVEQLASAKAPSAPPPAPPKAAACGPYANDRMLERCPEDQLLAKRKGTWNVVMTMQPAPDAKPIVVKGIIAERAMVGLYLQETMRPADARLPDFKRLAYLT